MVRVPSLIERHAIPVATTYNKLWLRI